MNLPTEVNTRAMEIRHQHPGLSYNDIGRAGKWKKKSEFVMEYVTISELAKIKQKPTNKQEMKGFL